MYKGTKQTLAYPCKDTTVWSKAWDTPLFLLSMDLFGEFCSSHPAHITWLPGKPMDTEEDLGHVLM